MKIYRNADPEPIELADVKVDLSTIYTRQLMGQHKVEANWISAAPMALTLGDYVTVGIEKLYLNRPVTFEKVNNFTYKYQTSFEGEVYRLYHRKLRHLGSKLFTYFGDPEAFLLLLLENINSIDPGWTLNLDLPVTYEPQYLSFDGENCRVALTRIMEAFGLEFRLVQKEIIVRQDVGFESLYSFEYGRHEGLYNLIRENADDSDVVTHLYGHGGTQNIPSGYRGGLKELGFDVEGKAYLEENVGLYGIREGDVTFPEIYPRRTGSITAVVANNIVQDSTLDFDINTHLIGGVTAKIVFKSGALSGYEFEIEKGGYNHDLRQIRFIPRDEANGAVIPDMGSFQPEVGDIYTLIGIDMPAPYVTASEAELLAATQDAHIKKKSPQGIYILGIDEKNVRTNGIELACGMRVGVKDTPIGLDEQIRIFAISFPYANPERIVAQIADTIPLTNEERYIKDVKQTKKDVVEVDRSRIEGIRESIQRTIKLKDRVYDPEGNYFDPVNFAANSIETLYFSSGAKSRFYSLNGVEIETNYTGNPNSLRISAGKLIHWAITIEGLGYIWEMDQHIFEELDPAETYYVYARCNKSALTGTWVVSIVPILTDQEAGFYHFQLGSLWMVANGMRFFEMDKGMTFIIGDMIKTGTVQSYDGLNFWNLTSGTWNMGEPEDGIDWGVSTPGKLTIRGDVIARSIEAGFANIDTLRIRNLKTADEGKRMEITAVDDLGNPLHNQRFYDQDGNLVVLIDTEVDSDQAGNPAAGIRVQNASNTRTAMITGNGHFSNAGGVSFLPATTGIETNASVAGLLFDRNADPSGISAGVVGMDLTESGNSKSWGGWFNSILAMGLHLEAKAVTGNYTMTSADVYISSYNSSSNQVFLPANPRAGRVAIIRRNNGDVLIKGNGKQILVDGLVSDKGLGSSNGKGDCALMIFDGSYWTFNRLRL